MIRAHITKSIVVGAIVAALCLLGAASAGAQLQFSSTSISLSDANGPFQNQAGAHPDLDVDVRFPLDSSSELPVEDVRDLEVQLPPGMIGNPTALEQCTPEALLNPGAGVAACPTNSQVGTARVEGVGAYVGLFNLVHDAHTPALLGFNYLGVTAIIRASVRPSDYGISSGSETIAETEAITGIDLKLWGVPADPSHDMERVSSEIGFPGLVSIPSSAPRVPFLTNPTSCSPAALVVRGDSWQDPGNFNSVSVSHDPDGTPFVFEGCERLPFSPRIAVQPLTEKADAPTGLNVDLTVPQNFAPDGLATSHLRRTVVSLPQGISISPSAAVGITSCGSAEVGLGNNDAPACPAASKIGTVSIETPLLTEQLVGDVILGRQNDNPFHSLLAMYLSVKGPGFYLKFPGKVESDPVTGQVTATFDDTPQLPFSHLVLHLYGGSLAALATPDACGSYETHTALTPWSGTATVNLGTPFAITSGCSGGFTPSFAAGVTDPVAGQNTGFVLRFSREDGQQHLRSITTSLPEGLLAKVAGVPLCSDAQAAAGTCGAESLVGTTEAAAGPGASPVRLPGNVYLTGPYKGAPYGLAIVVRAVAGPYDLGTVVVRAAIHIDPHDAHVTVVSDDIPHILDATGADGQADGFVLRIREIEVSMTRPGFMINPTSCDATSVGASAESWEGSSAALSTRFQIANCAALAFSPKFSASTAGKTSRANGASLDAKLLVGGAGQANIHVVSVSLPKQLPSRLTTIQKACPEDTFAANPAACPVASRIGSATTTTPLLAGTLSGPAYLVSHGGAAFPDLVVVLQGDGVTFDLVGAINISSKGITSTKFATAPDVPLSSFELKLPQGPHSVLAANGSLCAKPLVMPTSMTAYNGKQITQQTKITVTGCPKAKKKTSAKKKVAKKTKAKKK
jgi:hypothetical protein